MSVYRVVKCDVCGHDIMPFERTARIVKAVGRPLPLYPVPYRKFKLRHIDICKSCLYEIARRVEEARRIAAKKMKEGAK